MRPSQTVARVLLIASIANSALAASSPALEETHNVKRLKMPADFGENAKNLLKTTATVGSIAGLFASVGASLQRLIIGSNTSYSNGTPSYALLPCPPANASNDPNHDKHLTHGYLHRSRAYYLGARTPLPTEDPDGSPSLSQALSGLSDRDLQLLSTLSRRAIEMLD